jgi:glycosyltransferase involved in cell wall biosynthesis
MQYIIVQPWFVDPGHPAQSLVRTYRSTATRIKILSLVYIPTHYTLPKHLQEYIQECQSAIASCPRIFQSLFGTLIVGTFVIVNTIHEFSKKTDDLSVFFLDANFYILALALKINKLKVSRINTLCMVGPEFFQRNYLDKNIKWPLVLSLFDNPYFHLFLRTEDLANSWKAILPKFADRIDFLPSLELHSERQEEYKLKHGEKTFLVAGQIREQKFIKPLVTIFSQISSPGHLRIAGKFTQINLKSFVETYVQKNISVVDQFLTEIEMIYEFSKAHYNLMLYDPWDDRMESSMLFVSVKCCVPIVAFEGGWLGNRVIEEGIGWTIPRSRINDIGEFLQSLPPEESEKYQNVVNNIKSCYARWTSSKIVDLFINKLGWTDS